MVDVLMIAAGEITGVGQTTETGRKGITIVLEYFNTIIETIQNRRFVIGIVLVLLFVFASFSSVQRRSAKYTKAQITDLICRWAMLPQRG